MERYDNPCDGCPLENTSQPFFIHGKGRKRILIVGKAPNDRMVMNSSHMGGYDGTRLFGETFKELGYKKNDFRYISMIRCSHKKGRFETKEFSGIEKRCREYIKREVEQFDPEVIVTLGADAATQVMGVKVRVTKNRGKLLYSKNMEKPVFPMLDPDYCCMYPNNKTTFKIDAKRLKTLQENNYDEELISGFSESNYFIVRDLEFLIKQKPKVIALDIETTRGLRFYNKSNGIATIQLCVKEGEAYCIPWDHREERLDDKNKKRIIRQLKRLLYRPNVRVVGQNLKFDFLHIRRHLGIEIPITDDTLMLYALLDENSNNKDLAYLTKLYVPAMAGYSDYFDRTADKENLGKCPLDDLVQYGCGDVDACFRLFKILHKEVARDEWLLNHYRRVDMRAIRAFARIEYRGVDTDVEQMDRFRAILAEDIENRRKSLLARTPSAIKRKHVSNGKALSFTRPDFVRDILFRDENGFQLTPKVFTGTTKDLEDASRRVPSVSTKDHLPYFAEHSKHGKYVTDLISWIKDERLLSTNVVSFKKKYVHFGKIYPSYSLWTAVTGRTASSDPNAQNFPKRGENAKAYRKSFKAPFEYYMLQGDLSQAELRISSDMANDTTMLNIYAKDGDIHTITACIVLGVSLNEFLLLPKDERALSRFKAKAVNFGFIYGMGWRKFIVYAKTQYGVEFTERESKRIRAGFFNKYSSLSGWHDVVRRWARRHGYVRSYSGRIRHLPAIHSTEEYVRHEAERQAINSPVQEFASTLGVLALAHITENVDPYDMRVVAFVHDAVYCYVRREYLEWGAITLKRAMEGIPIKEWFGVNMKAPIKADLSFGLDMADMIEMSGLDNGEAYDFGKHADEGIERFNLPRQRVPISHLKYELAT